MKASEKGDKEMKTLDFSPGLMRQRDLSEVRHHYFRESLQAVLRLSVDGGRLSLFY